jgi:hypothetical protein
LTIINHKQKTVCEWQENVVIAVDCAFLDGRAAGILGARQDR